MPLPILSVEENYYFAIRVPLAVRTRELFDTYPSRKQLGFTGNTSLHKWLQFFFLTTDLFFFFFDNLINSTSSALLSVNFLFFSGVTLTFLLDGPSYHLLHVKVGCN